MFLGLDYKQSTPDTNSVHEDILRAVRYLGSQCVLCGYNKNMHALTLLPADSETPEFTGFKVTNFVNVSEIATAQNYVVVCCNCRAEIDYNNDHPIHN